MEINRRSPLWLPPFLDGTARVVRLVSHAVLAAFSLALCIDRVEFMESLSWTGRLRDRLSRRAKEEARAGIVIEAVLHRGIGSLLNLGDRQARRITAALFDRGVPASESTRAPLKHAFPAALVGRWFPGLFPEKAPPA